VKVNIDFYSKDEVAILLDVTSGKEFAVDDNNELFLFTSLVLRQLSNLAKHPVGTTLALVLYTFSDETAEEFLSFHYQFPDWSRMAILLDRRGLKFNSNYMMIHDEMMKALPSIIPSKGDGKKAFHITYPPLQMKLQGFGLLGMQVNYYSFHSVFGLFHFLARRHVDDEIYKKNLSAIASICGDLYFEEGVSLGDQASLAKNILKEKGII
jgi:hypothetical protein